MKTIEDIWKEVSASHSGVDCLQQACKEVVDFNDTGVLCEGLLREFAAKLEALGYANYQARRVAVSSIELFAVRHVSVAGVSQPEINRKA